MENDSFEDVFSLEEAINEGLKRGAEYVLECLDFDGSIDFEFVFPGECIGSIEKACWRSSFIVSCHYMNKLREAEGLEKVI